MTPHVPELVAGGLRLRPWTDDDAPAVVELARDEAAAAWLASLRRVTDIAGALEWLRVRRGPDRVDWAVTDLATGELVGRVGLHHFDEQSRNAEVGYVVWPAHRRRGVAAAMLEAATGHAFSSTMGLARVGLQHAVGNPASCAVAVRAGFAFEGVDRSSMDHGDGMRHDMHRHSRLATDPPGPAAPVWAAVEPVEIAAGRLQLRPLRAADAEQVLALLDDPQTRLWNPGPEPLDVASARSWCAGAGDWSVGAHASFAVCDATSGEVLGTVSLHRIDPLGGDAEVGYRTAPHARGRGVATDALAAVSRWAFGALGLARIELLHAVEHESSCRVAVRAGYPLEGVLRKSYVYGDGVRRDEHLHARLATD